MTRTLEKMFHRVWSPAAFGADVGVDKADAAKVIVEARAVTRTKLRKGGAR